VSRGIKLSSLAEKAGKGSPQRQRCEAFFRLCLITRRAYTFGLVKQRNFNTGHRLPACFHLLNNRVSQTLDVVLKRGGYALATFGNEVAALRKKKSELAGGNEAVFHEQVATTIEPRQLDVKNSIYGARVVRAILSDHLFSFADDAACQRAIRRSITDDFVGGPQFDGLNECFGQLHADHWTESVIADDGNIDRANIRVVQRTVAKLIGCTAGKQGYCSQQAACRDERDQNCSWSAHLRYLFDPLLIKGCSLLD